MEMKIRGLNYFLLMDIADIWKENRDLRSITLRMDAKPPIDTRKSPWKPIESYGEQTDDSIFEFRVSEARLRMDSCMQQLKDMELWIDDWAIKASEEYRLANQGGLWPESPTRYWDSYKKEIIAFLAEICLESGSAGCDE